MLLPFQAFSSCISECFSEVSDAIGVYHFEELIDHGDLEALEEGLRHLDLEAKDFNRRVSLFVTWKPDLKEERLRQFTERWVRLQPERTTIIWGLTSNGLEMHSDCFKEIVSLLGGHQLPIYIDNRKSLAPALIGQKGVYRMSPEEWRRFEKGGLKLGVSGICTLSVDVNRFFDGKRSFQEFRGMVRKAAKSLFLANWTLQEQGMNHFTILNKVNEGARLFYHLGSNQLRFLNFPAKGIEADHFLSLLESCQCEVTRFVKVQETILKSCGMPVDFNILFGAGKGTSEVLNAAKCVDFLKPEFQELFRRKERLARIIGGRDVLEWVTVTDDRKEWVHQVQYILDHVNVPLFCLCFGEGKGVIKLTSFLG